MPLMSDEEEEEEPDAEGVEMLEPGAVRIRPGSTGPPGWIAMPASELLSTPTGGVPDNIEEEEEEPGAGAMLYADQLPEEDEVGEDREGAGVPEEECDWLRIKCCWCRC